jgi:CRISPR-associated endonuclease Cas1
VVTAPAIRIISEGPALSSEDVADRVGAMADTYARHDGEGVAVVDGFGARVVVERGHLLLSDGVGEHRRVRRYPKADRGLRRVIVLNAEGVVSFEALRWCAGAGVAVVVLGANGAHLAASPSGREDARLLRAQALALYGPAGLDVVRYLIGEKLRGHLRVVRHRLDSDGPAATLIDLGEQINTADSIDAVRQLEAAAANVYWSAWERSVSVTFARTDVARVPTRWGRFNGRRSAVHVNSPRSATDPAGAMLNYGYKLAEVEAVLACRVMGLDPGIGVMHADLAGRPSFALDLIEAIRPLVDTHVLDLAAGPLRKRDFIEDARGVVRVMAPLTHALAEAMGAYGVALGPIAERVANILGESSPYDVTVPSVLTGEKHREASRRRVSAARDTTERAALGPNPGGLAPRGRRRVKPSPTPPLPLRSCKGCGGRLAVDADRDRPRIKWCPDCLPERRDEIGSTLHANARVAAQRFAEQTGTLPTHTAAAQAARSDANVRQRAEQQKWDMIAEKCAYDAELDAAYFEDEIRPKLATMTLPVIAKATGISTSAASKWRSGRTVPHRRHWAALARLVSVDGTRRGVGSGRSQDADHPELHRPDHRSAR